MLHRAKTHSLLASLLVVELILAAMRSRGASTLTTSMSLLSRRHQRHRSRSAST